MRSQFEALDFFKEKQHSLEHHELLGQGLMGEIWVPALLSCAEFDKSIYIELVTPVNARPAGLGVHTVLATLESVG